MVMGVFGSVCVGEAAAQTVLELAYSHPPGSVVDDVAKHFARQVNKKLGGVVRVEVFSKGERGRAVKRLQSVQVGKLDMSVQGRTMSRIVRELEMFDLPYLVRGRAHMQRIVDKIVANMLAPKAESKGVRILAVWDQGFRHISSKHRPIKSPYQLKGLKIRIGNQWTMTTFRHLGASAIRIRSSEVFAALARGVVDAQETSLAAFRDRKLYQVQKYLSLTGHTIHPAYLIISERRWKTLKRSTRKKLLELGREAQIFGFKRASRTEERLLSELRDTGVSIFNVDKNAFIAKSKGVYDEFSKKIPGGAKIIGYALSLR
jgi:tripartite ATP-independent transporter DctP family solute receptor